MSILMRFSCGNSWGATHIPGSTRRPCKFNSPPSEADLNGSLALGSKFVQCDAGEGVNVAIASDPISMFMAIARDMQMELGVP